MSFFFTDLASKLNNSQAELTMADLSSSQLKDDLLRKSAEFVKHHDSTKEDKVCMVCVTQQYGKVPVVRRQLDHPTFICYKRLLMEVQSILNIV